MNIIKLIEILGTEILSRDRIKSLLSIVNDDTRFLDFKDISFISRSAADEVFNLIQNYNDIELINLNPDVKIMLETVKKGRKSQTRRFAIPKKSTTFYCESMEEVKIALLSRESLKTSNQ